MERLHVPKLRFEEFKEEWIEIRLGEITSTFKSGFGITAKDILDHGNYPVYGGNGLRGYTDSFTHDGMYILIGRQGALCGNINLVRGQQFITEHAVAVQTDDLSDNEWLAQKLEFMNLNQYSESSAQPGLAVNKLVRLKLFTPSLPEQQKIASFLTAVDDKIQLLNKKKELLTKYKKSVMQKLFSQEIRFKDDEGNDYPNWEEKSLGEIGKTFNGLTGKTAEHFGEGKPYVTYKQIFDDSKLNINLFGFVKINLNENQSLVKYGDVFFTTSSETSNEIGTSAVILDTIDELYLNSFCFGYRINSQLELSSFYARYLFRSPLFRKIIMPLAQGSTRYNISKVELMKLKIRLPSVNEQIKIANFLSSLDEKISSINQQITHSQAYKKGLLPQMFV